MKAKKIRRSISIRKDTYKKLKNFCEKSGTWTMSLYIDIAVNEKLKREEKT